MDATEIGIETLRATVVAMLLLLLWRKGRKESLFALAGWRQIVIGVSLVLAGSLLDITDNFPVLNKYLVIGDTAVESFLEKVVGYLGGYIFLFIGFMRWIPLAAKLDTARAELRANETRFRAMVETTTDWIWEVDSGGRYTYSSPLVFQLLGYTPDELLGRTPFDFMPAEEAARVGALFAEIAGARQSFTLLENTCLHKDGHAVILETSGVPLFGPTGDFLGYHGIDRDITERKQAEDELRRLTARLKESERRLSTLLDDTKIHLWAFDGTTYTYTNRQWFDFTGQEPDSFTTIERWVSAVHPEDLEEAYRIWMANWETKTEHDNHFRLRRHDGVYRDFYCHAVPITDENGVFQYFQGFNLDITERKAAEAELEQHRHHLEELVQQRTAELMETEARASLILQSSSDGLCGIDNKGRITFINAAGCAILGCQGGQAIGRDAHDLFHHSRTDGIPYPVEECPIFAVLRRGEPVRVDDEVFQHADGHAVPVMYAAHPMVNHDGIAGAVISFVDMTEQRAAAQAREQALVAAENLARVRQQFLANMSHEIRTPLNGVLGFAQIGLRNCQNSEKARDAFTKIQASGNQLLGVVNDILDFSKIEAGKLTIEQTKVILAETIEHSVETVRERARAKQIDLRIELAPDLPRTCVGDPLRLGQVLLNLLCNAIKFTEAGSVTLSASRQDDSLVFRVTDTGIGMSQGQVGQLFNAFQQADASATRRFGGTGLGLAISKHLLELMGGDIRVESRLGVGSTFEFRLPYVQPRTQAVEPVPGEVGAAPSAGNRLAGISILVAEDDAINRLVLEEFLTQDGARVVMAGDGREAVDRVIRDGRGAYDIVLMDIQMSGMDGYEATRRLLELAPDLPIIGQTAHAFAEERERCIETGMVAHIAKPVDREALVALVRQHVSPGRTRQLPHP